MVTAEVCCCGNCGSPSRVSGCAKVQLKDVPSWVVLQVVGANSDRCNIVCGYAISLCTYVASNSIVDLSAIGMSSFSAARSSCKRVGFARSAVSDCYRCVITKFRSIGAY